MNYTIEAREIKQKIYGQYCNLCRKLNISIKPYYLFEIKDLENLK